MSSETDKIILADITSMSPRYYAIGNWPYVVNLANSIIGVSILALPFCFKECGIILGLVLLVSSAWLSQFSCRLLMKTSFVVKKRSYEYLALHIFGLPGKLLVEISIIGLLIGTCVAFYIIIGDLGPAVLSKATGLENTSGLRTCLLCILGIFVILPLAMRPSLDSISNLSAMSLTFYGVFVFEMILTAFPNIWSAVWVAKVVYWNSDGVFKCLPIFALSFACQTQLFIVYDSLPEASLKRIHNIVNSAIVLCSLIYFSIGYFGYVAFYNEEISGDILMNFHPTVFSELIKLGFLASTVISFPLVIFPCRASLYKLLFAGKAKGLHDNFGGSVHIPQFYFKLITVSIVTVTLILGILVPNVEFVLGITGATLGSLICYILPALMFIQVMAMEASSKKSLAQFVLFVGMTILLASTYVTISDSRESSPRESVVKIAQPIMHQENKGSILKLDDAMNHKNDYKVFANKAKDLNERVKKDVQLEIPDINIKNLQNGKHVVQSSDSVVQNDKPNSPDVFMNEIDRGPDKRKHPPNPQAPSDENLNDKKDRAVKEQIVGNSDHGAKEQIVGNSDRAAKEQIVGNSDHAAKEQIVGNSDRAAKEQIVGNSDRAAKEQIVGNSDRATKEQIVGNSDRAAKEHLEQIIGDSDRAAKEQIVGNSDRAAKEQIIDDSDRAAKEQIVGNSDRAIKEQIVGNKVHSSNESAIMHAVVEEVHGSDVKKMPDTVDQHQERQPRSIKSDNLKNANASRQDEINHLQQDVVADIEPVIDNKISNTELKSSENKTIPQDVASKFKKDSGVVSKLKTTQVKDFDKQEANQILIQLKEQQEEQKKLLDEHRQIINELKKFKDGVQNVDQSQNHSELLHEDHKNVHEGG